MITKTNLLFSLFFPFPLIEHCFKFINLLIFHSQLTSLSQNNKKIIVVNSVQFYEMLQLHIENKQKRKEKKKNQTFSFIEDGRIVLNRTYICFENDQLT